MSLKLMFLTIFLLFIHTTQLNLIPDKTNPLVVESGSKNLHPVIKIRFSFPSENQNELGPKYPRSSGLATKQFIGLQFPHSFGSQLRFDQNLDWDCELSDGTYKYRIEALTSVASSLNGTDIDAEKNVAYCQLTDDSVNVPLKTGPGILYTLSIAFSSSFSNSFIRGLSLFTSTSNAPDKIIIDSLPQLGSFAIYDDYEAYSEKPIDIIDSDITVTAGADSSDNVIYPGSVFDINLKLSCSYFLTSSDYMIVINYPDKAVTGPTSVVSIEAASGDATQAALDGNLTLRNVEGNRLIIEGINEDLVPGRQFILNLKGLIAKNTDLENNRNIEVYIYYRNTLSIVSYAHTSIINVRRISLTVTANHPEFWDIYRNAAWPIKITFRPNTDVINDNGFYVVIRQDNALLSSATGGNIMTFIASTCDFSDNSSFDNSFGNRPSCYPLRLDHKYNNESTTDSFKGSGIFFYLPGPLYNGDEFYVTVWVFADVCGGDIYNNVKGTASTSPNFEVSILKDIRTNYLNEDRYDFDLSIASGSGRFQGKCWNNKIQSFTYDSSSSENINSADDNFNSEFDDDVTANTPSLYLRFKEIFSWRIGSSSQQNYLDDIRTSIEEKFLFSQTNGITSNSYFVAEADLNLATNTKISTALPGCIQNDTILPGTLTVQFSKKWFTGTENFKSTGTSTKCYLSWGLKNPSNSPVNRNVLSVDVTASASSTLTNFIGAEGHNEPDFDEGRSNLVMSPNTDNTRENIMKLVSKRNSADGNQIWKYFPDEVPSNNITKVAWYSNCLNWKTSAQIKSLFTYIDIQFQWTYSSGSGASANVGIFSNVRLIKLFPEGGVFHDKAKVAGTAPFVNPYVNHSVLSNPNHGIQAAVCLIELNGKAISAVADGDFSSGVFGIWVGFGSLLETDYSDASATYPTGPLIDIAIPYGLQSQSPMHPENLYVSENYTNQNVPLYVTLSQLQNPVVFGSSSSDPLKGENTSSYHFLMGSVLLITGLTSKTIQNSDPQGPLYIPYYCPYAYPTINTDLRKYLNFSPSIFGAWLNMSSYSEITNLNRFLYYGESSGSDVIHKVSILLPKSDSTSAIKLGAFKGKGAPSAQIESTNQILGTLRWNAYTDTNDSVLNFFSGTKDNPNGPITCTGFSLFLNLNSLRFDSIITFGSFSGKGGYYDSSKIFYVSGNKFTDALFWGGLSDGFNDMEIGNITPSDPAVNSSSFEITGITRPSLESFLNDDNQMIVSDKLGFSCAPADTTQYEALVNYFYDNLQNRANFILDFTPSITGTWKLTIGYDKNDNYLSDIAGNAKFQLNTPATIPIGADIVFKSDSFNQQTLCGIVFRGSFAKNCNSIDSEIHCEAPDTTTKFTICCYNIELSDILGLSVLKVNFKAENFNLGIRSYLTQYIYDGETEIANDNFTFQTNNSSAVDVINTKSATVSSVTYSQSNQISGIGKITLIVTLPREPVRDMILTVTGNMDLLLVEGTIPRCVATFSSNRIYGSNWDSGDIIIDTCLFSKNGNLIKIKTKKMIYKCGQTFSKTLYISLWPVVLVDWNNNSIPNTFTVKLENSIGSAIALNTQQFKLKLKNSLKIIPSVIGQWNNLCSVSSITPRLPGEISEYLFQIDLDSNAPSITGSELNEVTIFWPFDLYGSNIKNVYCYSNGKLLNCYFTDEGILNIRFQLNLPIGSGSKIPITVTGVPNPEVNTDIIFVCTINSTNFATGDRTNVLTGSGKFEGGISLDGVVNSGNIRFLTLDTKTSNTLPREVSTHRFRIAFDEAIGLTTIPNTIDGTPVIYIYFPVEYNLGWYSNEATAIIDEYSNNDINIISKTNTYNPFSVVITGNRVTITFAEDSIEFSQNFKYWDIILSNIPNPSDATTSTDTRMSQTTSPFYITLTNTKETVLYNTITNVNTYSFDIFSGSTYNLLRWNRGNSFDFDKSRWIVDIYSTDSQLNRLALRPGRYTVARYAVRSNKSLSVKNASANINLNDSIFKIAQPSGYKVVTALQQPVNFLVGTACGTASGYYIINFSLSDNINFTPLSPVLVIVDSSTKGIISFQNPPAVSTLGSGWIPILINEYNFETLNINWNPAPNSVNDPDGNITNLVIEPTLDVSDNVYNGNRVIGYSVFTYSSSDAPSKIQQFSSSDPNNCWTFNGSNNLSIIVMGTISDIPSNIQLNSHFAYSNADNDETVDKSSITIHFTPPLNSLYLYCALTCFNKDFPLDSAIITGGSTNSSELQYYQSFFNNNPDSFFSFRNLIRGQQYKLRCIVQSIHADVTRRTQASFNFDQLRVLGDIDNSTANLVPVASFKPRCIQWNINPITAELADAITYQLLNYCQNIFSNGGFYNNGCVICSNSSGNAFVPGFSSFEHDTCSASSRLRNLQSTSDNKNLITTSALNICALSFQTCKSDVGPVKTYTDLFQQLVDNTNSNSLLLQNLNINSIKLDNNVPNIVYSDTEIPNLNRLYFSFVQTDLNGAFAFTARAESPLRCYWQLSDIDASTPPDWNSISSCSTYWCGLMKVGTYDNTFTLDSENLIAFTEGVIYNIFFGCVNDVPYPENFSSVKLVSSFSYEKIPEPVVVGSALLDFRIALLYILITLAYN